MRIDAQAPQSQPVDWMQIACQEYFNKPSQRNNVSLHYLENKKLSVQENFFRQYASYAVHTQRLTGIPASVTLAQAALESGWGRHAPGNNFFGIKGKGPAGSQSLWTREFHQGRLQRVRARFRRYETPLQSFVDHAQVISKGTYLKHAMKQTGSAKAFITALQSGKHKYATDPRYPQKIMNLIERYRLDRLDIGGAQ